MALQQIAFAFDDLPQQPQQAKPEKKRSAPKPKPRPIVAVDFEKPKVKSTRGRKSIKAAAANADMVEIPDDEVLFSKMYYSIGKVAEMFKVNQSLIRLWENEFDVLKPKKNGKGDRLFRPEDNKTHKLIHHLIREKKYTMEGAKEYIRNSKRSEERYALVDSLKKLKGFLNELKAQL